jgi:hypothetical protein
MKASDRVKAWIAEHFEPEAIKVVAFPLLPGGHRVIDKTGEEILAHYDIMTDSVKHLFPARWQGELAKDQRKIFEAILEKHLASMGEAERAKHDLERVEWDEEEQVFKVYYTNGKWWNYTLEGTWY